MVLLHDGLQSRTAVTTSREVPAAVKPPVEGLNYEPRNGRSKDVFCPSSWGT